VLDPSNWNGTLLAGFVNAGEVLDHCSVKVDTCYKRVMELIWLSVTPTPHHDEQNRYLLRRGFPLNTIGTEMEKFVYLTLLVLARCSQWPMRKPIPERR